MSPEQELINRARNALLDFDCGGQTLEETAEEIRVAGDDYAEAIIAYQTFLIPTPPRPRVPSGWLDNKNLKGLWTLLLTPSLDRHLFRTIQKAYGD